MKDDFGESVLHADREFGAAPKGQKKVIGAREVGVGSQAFRNIENSQAGGLDY